MPSVKIELPAAWSFRTELPVRITDVNYGGHVGNDALLAMIQEARVRWLGQFGWTEKLDERIGLIVVDVSVRFKAELHYGDTLVIQLAPAEWSRPGFDLVYLLSRPDGAEVARARTGFVFFDYALRKMAPAPEGFRARVEGGDPASR